MSPARKNSPTGPHDRVVALLGPQHGATPDVGAALAELGLRGPVALVTAGYQEREPDDAAIVASLGVPAVNLKLHARATEVFAGDPEFAAAYRARQARLRHIQSFYRIRLDATDDGARRIAVRHVDSTLLAQEEKVSVDQFRQLDVDHIERCTALHREFNTQWEPLHRPLIASHQAELRAALEGCSALVIAGGHVASLLNRLVLFDVLELARFKPVVAWSAGAMVLTERVLLFHDYPPYGSDIAQILDAGLALVGGIVVLPDAKRRVRFDDRSGIQRFARRMAPATCVAMDPGARVIFEGGKIAQASAARLTTSGEVETSWTGRASRFSSPHLRGRV